MNTRASVIINVIIRWVARVASGLFLLWIYWLVGIGSAVGSPITWEVPAVLLAQFLIAWFFPKIGGTFYVAAGIALILFGDPGDRAFFLLTSLPFFIIGLLCWMAALSVPESTLEPTRE